MGRLTARESAAREGKPIHSAIKYLRLLRLSAAVIRHRGSPVSALSLQQLECLIVSCEIFILRNCGWNQFKTKRNDRESSAVREAIFRTSPVTVTSH